MTLKVKQNGVFTAVGGSGSTDEWVRPADWVTLPTVNSGEHKVVGLVAVYEGDSNFVGVNCSGAYTVDWGDGSAPVNVAAGVSGIKNILWSSVGSGTLTTGGYRQAVITITPQAGQTLTQVILNPTLASVAVSSSAATPWLDVRMAGANVTSLAVSSTGRPARLLQQFEYVGPSAITAAASAFNSASALRSVVGTQWTATITSFFSMFQNCVSLNTAPTLSSAAGLSFASMFAGCIGLTTVQPGALNTAAATDLSAMFNNCSALVTIALSAASSTNNTNTFAGCNNLQVGAMAGTKTTISYASCKLSATQLDAIYSNLASGVTGQTITVTGNHGVAADTPSIATGRGWTVTG